MPSSGWTGVPKRDWPLLTVLGVFAAITGAYLTAGPQTMGDTARYMNGAGELLATGAVTGKAANYKGYVLFVAATKSLAGDAQLHRWLIVILQALASGAALLCLYSLGRMLFSRQAGLIAAGLFAVNFYALRWTSQIATDSLFMAFLVIACWLCGKALARRSLLIPAVVVTLFAVSIRPNGTAMLPMFALVLILSMRGVPRTAVLIASVMAAIVLYPAVNQELNRSASHEDLAGHFEKGTVIWQVESIDMPELEQRSGDQVADVIRYVRTYPAATLALVGKRLFAAWSWQRAGYSDRHRLFLALVLPALYLLALAGLWTQVRSGLTPGHLLPVLLVLAQSAVIAVSFANHDHRFVNAVMPMIFLFAGAGATALRDRLRGPGARPGRRGHGPGSFTGTSKGIQSTR